MHALTQAGTQAHRHAGKASRQAGTQGPACPAHRRTWLDYRWEAMGVGKRFRGREPPWDLPRQSQQSSETEVMGPSTTKLLAYIRTRREGRKAIDRPRMEKLLDFKEWRQPRCGVLSWREATITARRGAKDETPSIVRNSKHRVLLESLMLN